MPKRTLTSLAGIALLLALGFLAVFTVMPPGVRGTGAPEGEFSAARAFIHVQRLGRATHVTGSPANDSVRDYLVSTMRGMGLDPQIQDAVTVTKDDEGKAVAARVRNIVAVINGTGSTGRVILMAHYDSVQNGSGANDDGAGVSAILETTRALLTGPKSRNDIVLLITDAEEACLCGAQAFVDQHPIGQGNGVVLNVEARGSSGAAIMFETSAGNADVVGSMAGTRRTRSAPASPSRSTGSCPTTPTSVPSATAAASPGSTPPTSMAAMPITARRTPRSGWTSAACSTTATTCWR